jgi:hypothetical protein
VSALQDLLTTWAGRGREISIEQIAREADCAERTCHRWLEGESEPTLQAYRNMLASTVLAAGFRKALADYLLHRSIDLRVVHEAPPTSEPNPHPMMITFDHCAALVTVQRDLERAVGEASDGGAEITEAEHAELARGIGEVERLTAELRRAVAARANGRGAAKRQRA